MKKLLKKLLSSETETEVLEFKEAKTQYDINTLGKYFSALSNEANLKKVNSAWILFGVRNDKKIVGSNIDDKHLNNYKREIASFTSPRLSFVNIERIDLQGKSVVMLQIPSAPQGMPVSWKGHYYGRDGESLGALNINEIERIRNQNILVDWSAEVVECATINDLSKEAIEIARIQFAEKNPKIKDEILIWDDIKFLNKAKICINGKITRTGILLLGKPESEYYLNPAVSKISWILKDRDGIEKDYEHFTCPLLLAVQKVYSKIRNLKYRYLKEGTLFPDEVDQYDPYIIREALNNCIAHQDYALGGKINVVEREDGVLVFSNSGDFIPQTVESVIRADAPETKYRNPFLANAMVNLNMIDTIGSGIKKMFVIQKKRFFPLPEYDLSNKKVTVSIIGKVMDLNYAKKLAQMPELGLPVIMLLDRVAKKKNIEDFEIKQLKSRGLIEGRKPNYFISAIVAANTGQQSDYIKLRGIEDDYLKKLIYDYLKKFPCARRGGINQLLQDKMPDVLSENQKQHKIKNLLQKMKSDGIIELDQNRQWHLKGKSRLKA